MIRTTFMAIAFVCYHGYYLISARLGCAKAFSKARRILTGYIQFCQVL